MKKHIFVLDDDEAILEAIHIILEDNGFAVTALSEGSAIEHMIAKNRPDLILLDIWMSGRDGVDITKSLKGDPDTKHIPIILISANNAGKQMAEKAGADGYIAKPFEIDHLLAAVDALLSRAAA